KAHVATLEGDQHLLSDLRPEVCGPPWACHRYGEARPKTRIGLLVPWKAHLHASESVRVTVFRDHGYRDAIDAAAGLLRCCPRNVLFHALGHRLQNTPAATGLRGVSDPV